jgi:anti-sigma factor (TIGR02949 family)
MDCKLVRGHLDAYVDGEIEPSPLLEFERHLDACSGCRNEVTLARAVQRGVQELVAPAAPAALRQRVLRSLDERGDRGLLKPGVLKGVLTSAAAVALVAGAVVRTDGGGSSASTGTRAGLVDMPPLLGDIVARHTDELPADIAAERPEQVANWSRGKVGFRVRSVEFSEPRVQLVGARVSNVRDQQAVKLYYRVGDSRLTSVVFQSRPSLHEALTDAQLAPSWGARRERIGSRMVTYRNVQGYTVPMIEHDGVVYAFTGDLDQRRLLQLVANARLP